MILQERRVLSLAGTPKCTDFHVNVRNFSGAMPRTQVWVTATVPPSDPTLEPHSENTGFGIQPLSHVIQNCLHIVSNKHSIIHTNQTSVF